MMVQFAFSVVPYTQVMITVSYSDPGSRYARQALSPETGEPSLATYRDGFQRMLDDSEVTAAEKSLAKLGQTFISKKSLPGAEAAMQTVAATVPGPIGHLLAKVTLSAAQIKEPRAVLRSGCEAVVEDSQAYSAPWCLGKLGIQAGEKTDSDKEAVKLRKHFLAQITNQEQGSKGAVIDAALGALEHASSSTARGVLRKTFELLQEHPELSQHEKDMAGLGIAFGEKPDNDGDAVILRRAVLEGMKAGLDAAGVCLKVADQNVSWSAKRAAMRATLVRMTESAATEAERVVAQFGIDAGSKTDSDKDGARVRGAVLEALTGRRLEDPVAALVEINQKVAELGIGDETRRSMLRTALLKIQELSPNPAQQALAALGVEVGSKSEFSDKEAARMRQMAIDGMTQSDRWSAACVVANACLQMVEGTRNWNGARATLRAGFTIIETLPGADPTQIELARKGIKDGASGDDDKRAALARIESMKAIVDREMTLIRQVEDQWNGVMDENGVEVQVESDYLMVGDHVVQANYE